jgi:citrate synthase
MVVEGLEGVVVAESEISVIDGEEGELVYRGYNIHDLAQDIQFEELLSLLWDGDLPNQEKFEEIRQRLDDNRAVNDDVLELMRSQAAQDVHPMAALRTGVSSLSAFDPDADADAKDEEANYRKAHRITAKMITLVAAFDRYRNGKEPLSPNPDLSHAGNFLYMLNGQEPSQTAVDAFNTCLVLHADHGLNASTFSGRVTASTLSDIHCAITSAIGTLKGPLHGGANMDVMRMLLEIDEADADPVDFVKEKLNRGEKIAGFGHRVYDTEDPRATHLREMSEQLGEQNGTRQWFEYSRAIEDFMLEDKGINCNVDFYSASTFYQLGVPIDIFTTIFASSRVVGWLAHVMEQYENNRLIRPRAEYVGERDRTVTPLSERS